jgi:hypothetical protein
MCQAPPQEAAFARGARLANGRQTFASGERKVVDCEITELARGVSGEKRDHVTGTPQALEGPCATSVRGGRINRM